MNLNLKGKVIVVSGGSMESNRSITELLITEEAIAVIIGDVLDNNTDLMFAAADVTNSVSCQSCIQQVLNKFGKIDGLVNNSVADVVPALKEITPQQFSSVLQHSLSPYFLLTQYALPALKVAQGVIVNIIPAIHASVNAANGYTALTREWAVDLLKYNIRVNAVLCTENKAENNELAQTVAFLLSERSSHITGQFIHTNG